MDSSFSYSKFQSNNHQLEDIKEDTPSSASNWIPSLMKCVPPETPTESMEFLARSWSLSSMELSKALTNTFIQSNVLQNVPLCSTRAPTNAIDSTPSFSIHNDLAIESELNLLQRALDQDFLTNQQQLLKTGLYRSVFKGKMVGRRLKDQKEKKKQEIRTQNAQLYAAISVAGVAAAVAAIAAATAMSSETSSPRIDDAPSKTSAAVASAAALVASHCFEIAEEMGADHNQIIMAVKSAVNIKTNGDIMALTAGAATALRGAATLKAKLKGYQNAAFASAKEQVEEGKELEMSATLNFVHKGGELLKRTRKGDLHWKQVSFYMNSDGEVIAKLKSKYMVGAFTKKKKCVVSDVECDIFAWPGRERDEDGEQRSYFGIKTADRIIEFECRKYDKQMWIDGIRKMLYCRVPI